MASPLKGCNIVGTLTVASSSSTSSGNVDGQELSIPIGMSIASAAVELSNLISLPGRKMSVTLLAQLSSGTATIALDYTTDGTAPAFSGGNSVSYQVTRGEPVFLELQTADATQTNVNGVITTTAKQNTVGVKITNQAGAALTVSKLRLLSSMIVDPNTADWFDVKTAFLVGAPPTNLPASDKSGAWVSST